MNPTWTRETVVSAYVSAEEEVAYRPRILCLESTNACNYRCLSCPRPKRRPKYLSVEEIATWLPNLIDFAPSEVWLHFSGEPLLHPRLVDIIEHVAAEGISPLISTNCSLLTERRSAKLLSSSLSGIVFSVDATQESTYRRLRVGGELAAVEENILGFLQQRGTRRTPVVQAQLVLSDQDPEEVLDFLQVWKAREVDEIALRRFSTRTGLLRAPKGCLVDVRPKPDRQCLDPWLNVVITADGLVLPCCADFGQQLVLGSLTESSIEEIWNGPIARSLRRSHAGHDPRPTACQRCTDSRTAADWSEVEFATQIPNSLPELRALLTSGSRHFIFRKELP